MAALVLVGCTPPEPTEEELLAETASAVDGFNRAIDDQFASGQVDVGELQEFAVPSLAAEWANYVQQDIDEGVSSRGVQTITNQVLIETTSDRVLTHLCLDGSEIVTTMADGTTQPPSELTAWEASFVPAPQGSSYVLETFEPIAEAEVCV
jgi:hypothetical protein